MEKNQTESLVEETSDPLISRLNKSLVLCVKMLALLMVVVIWLAFIDVIIHLYQQISFTDLGFFDIETLLTTLGDFLAVLIAIEIFLNIVFYLKKDAIHVPLVLATALTAVARKVIVLDAKVVDPHHIYAVASVIFALGISYWLVSKKD